MTDEYDTIATTCKTCGVTFHQLADPGRRRVFCSGACRQKDYRQRTGANPNRARDERKAREDDRRREDARRARERRARQAQEEAERAGATWTRPRTSDSTGMARSRARCRKLLERANHPKTPEHEATACREAAERIRKAKGL